MSHSDRAAYGWLFLPSFFLSCCAPLCLRAAFRVIKALLSRLEKHSQTMAEAAEAAQGEAGSASAPVATAAISAANPLLSWASSTVTSFSNKVRRSTRNATKHGTGPRNTIYTASESQSDKRSCHTVANRDSESDSGQWTQSCSCDSCSPHVLGTHYHTRVPAWSRLVTHTPICSCILTHTPLSYSLLGLSHHFYLSLAHQRRGGGCAAKRVDCTARPWRRSRTFV